MAISSAVTGTRHSNYVANQVTVRKVNKDRSCLDTNIKDLFVSAGELTKHLLANKEEQ